MLYMNIMKLHAFSFQKEILFTNQNAFYIYENVPYLSLLCLYLFIYLLTYFTSFSLICCLTHNIDEMAVLTDLRFAEDASDV